MDRYMYIQITVSGNDPVGGLEPTLAILFPTVSSLIILTAKYMVLTCTAREKNIQRPRDTTLNIMYRNIFIFINMMYGYKNRQIISIAIFFDILLKTFPYSILFLLLFFGLFEFCRFLFCFKKIIYA